ncbi:MAG: ATP-binding cassette domain-containing protein [Chloroflexota bacterium]
MIEAQNISFNYRPGEADAVPALRDVSLSIAEGERVALVGHNGSGKSTFVQLLIAALYPTGGRLRIDGYVSEPEYRWDIRERVAVVFQDPDNQLVANRVVDDVAFGPENLGLPRAEIALRVVDALEMAGIRDLADELISELSIGQRQKVALAGALAMRPRYLVLDEPSAFLSPSEASRLIDELLTLRERSGTAILYSTHNMSEAARFDRLVVLDRGRVAADASTGEVFGRPERVEALGLDIPIAPRIAERLKSAGVPLPGDPVTPHSLRVSLEAIVGKVTV